MKWFLVVLLSITATGAVRAGNPAHPTLLLLQQKADMIKLIDDVNTKSTWITKNMGKDSSIEYYNVDAGNGKRLEQFTLSVKATASTQVGLTTEQWKNGPEDKTSAFVDTTVGRTSLACIIPMTGPSKPIVGLRYKLTDDVTAFAKICEKSKPMYGLSYSRNLTVDVAYGDKVTQVRLSKAYGNTTPELRFRFTPKENFYGGAICFRFKK